MKYNIPQGVKDVAKAFSEGGFEAYLVGGCVRDLLLGREPKDWDIATNARPEEILKLFQDAVYENTFGTVGVKTESEDSKLKVLEVTTYRKEGRYTDKRHPDEVKFAKTIKEDLARRDFTVNAMALKLSVDSLKLLVVDPYGGQKDLEEKIIRAVGEPEERFAEDALRLMRAVRFAAELDFEVEAGTAAAITTHSDGLKAIAVERIRDEFMKLVMASGAMRGVQMLEDLGLLTHSISELREGIGCEQNLHHIYDVWEHNLRALDYAAEKGYALHIRLGALFHDIGKPKSKRGQGRSVTFYGHEVVGARMVKKIMERLKFSKEISEKVRHLVRHHMFFYNMGEVSEAGVRRLLARVGVENLDDLLKIREADRIGSGVPKARPYKIRHLLFMIDKVRRDPISPKMLKLKGDAVMGLLDIGPGPRVGWILSTLMDEVLEYPQKNTTQDLGKRIKELGKLSDEELQGLAKKGREKMEREEAEIEKEIKRKHRV